MDNDKNQAETKKKEVIISQIKPIVESDAPVRVAFYVRVSTDTELQMNSFENQKASVEVVLKQHPEFQLVKIYSDAGISGTLAEKRPGFMEMIADCKSGKIDLIYTMSLSRWSRNTLECLQYYRALKDIGVNLIFEKECIDTRNIFTEMALSIYASFSQEESRSISENTKMGIRMRYAMGETRWAQVYGLRRDYVIDEMEGGVVRTMFNMFEHGTSMRDIADYLNSKGIPSPKNTKWNRSGVLLILSNEKYAGDLVMQKSYTTDHLTHRVIKNDGTVVPTYTVKDHHKGIISHEQFDRVQAIRIMHGGGKNGYDQYPFGDKLVCPYCGARLKQRNLHCGAWAQGQGWECKSCGQFMLKSKNIEAAVMDAYESLDMGSIEAHLPKMKPERKDAAKRLIQIRQTEEVSEVHFYWVDQLIDRIEFGKFEGANDKVLMVRWKFGLTSTRQVKSRKTPKQYAEKDKKSKFKRKK